VCHACASLSPPSCVRNPDLSNCSSESLAPRRPSPHAIYTVHTCVADLRRSSAPSGSATYEAPASVM